MNRMEIKVMWPEAKEAKGSLGMPTSLKAQKRKQQFSVEPLEGVKSC